MRARSHPYIWAKNISALLAGDAQCVWAQWFKAHYEDYETLPDTNSANLDRWRVEHDDMVNARARALRQSGFTVTLEEENKFKVPGKVAVIGGKPDIVAIASNGVAVIEDAKTGKKRREHAWQVITYMLMIPRQFKHITNPAGKVLYPGSDEYLSPAKAQMSAEHVYGTIKLVGGSEEPKPVPSYRECRFCNIACCEVRMKEETLAAVTDDF